MSEHKTNGEKALGAWIYRSASLLMNAGALIIMLTGGLWLKNNVPSKEDFKEFKGEFKELQSNVNSMDRNLIKLNEANKHFEDLEKRVKNIEDSFKRRLVP